MVNAAGFNGLGQPPNGMISAGSSQQPVNRRTETQLSSQRSLGQQSSTVPPGFSVQAMQNFVPIPSECQEREFVGSS